MAVASWLLGGRSLRSRRNHNKSNENDEDFVFLDSTKDVGENMYEILWALTRGQGLTEGRRLNYLVNFVKLVSRPDVNYDDFGYNAEEILYCLRPLAFDESTQLRNASFRAVRHFIRTEEHVDLYIKLKFDFLVARQVTAAGIQLCRRVLCVCPAKFTPAPVQAMVALVHPNHSDNLQATALAFLSELAVLNPEVFVSCGGVSAIVRNLPFLKPKMTEALIAPLLYLLNRPETREKAGINLHCLTDPVFMDRTLSSKRGGGGGEGGCTGTGRVSTTALVCLLRSWAGVLHLGRSQTTVASIVNTLYIANLQRVMLSALYEVFGLVSPEWTDDMASALEAVDPGRWHPRYSLADGFVASEALGLHPHLASTRVSPIEVHGAIVLRTLLEAYLLDAIVHVIVSDDPFRSVNATILLGELLVLVDRWLPTEVTKLLPGLPSLISYSIRGRPVTADSSSLFHDAKALEEASRTGSGTDWSMASMLDVLSRRCSSGGDDSITCAEKRSRAQTAVRALATLSAFRRNPPSPSLYMSELASIIKPTSSATSTLNSGCLEECIKESGLVSFKDPNLSNIDPNRWNWDAIQAVLKMGSEGLSKSVESTRKMFLRRLVNFYLPGRGNFSKIAASAERRPLSKFTLAALDLITLLLASPLQSEIGSFVMDLLSGIKSCVMEILSSKSAYDCFLSPHACSNTHARDYFLMLGRFSRSEAGRQALERSGIYPILIDLVTTTNHECYIKLIVSALDYGNDESARKLLNRAIEAKSEGGRFYVTRLLHGMLRMGLPAGNLRDFIFLLLVLQLEDKKRAVADYAVSVLQEATDVPEYTECLVKLSPGLVRLGDEGHLLMVKLLASPTGFTQMERLKFVSSELDKWANHFNYRYVCFVEGMLMEGVSRSSDANRWQETSRVGRVDPSELYLPPHLYQQLCTHPVGRNLVLNHPSIPNLVRIVLEGQYGDDSQVLSLKAALYALSGIIVHLDSPTTPISSVGESTPIRGSDVIGGHTTGQKLVSAMIDLATKCPVYSVRGVANIALSNVATTQLGAQLLYAHNWHSTRHNRHEKWPLVLNDCGYAPGVEPCESISEGVLDPSDSVHLTPIDKCPSLIPPTLDHIESPSKTLIDTRESGNEKVPCVELDMSSSKMTDSLVHPLEESSDTSSELNKSNSLIEDTILEDDSSCEFFWGVPGGRTERVRERRCITLPPHHSAPTPSRLHPHLRSYSESKATDLPTHKHYDPSLSEHNKGDWCGRKARSNSYTDSCTNTDSYYKVRHHSFSERPRVPGLVPIQSVGRLVHTTPSQSSRLKFNILSQASAVTGKLKRSSESMLKTLAPPSPYPEELITYGDLLRLDSGTPSRLEQTLLDPEEADFSVIDETSNAVIRPITPDHPSQQGGDEADGGVGTEEEEESEEVSSKRTCYLGICLPEDLAVLFPREDRLAINNHVAFVAKVLHSQCLEDLKNPNFHREICFLRSRGVHNTMVSTSESDGGGYMMSSSELDLDKEPLQDNDSDSDTPVDIPYMEQPMPIIYRSPLIIRTEILRMVEQLSNPLLHKTCKQSLLQIRQAHGEVFKEMCVLSDVCHVLSVCHVRAPAREMIHELFDTGSEVMCRDARSYLDEVNERRGFNDLYPPPPPLYP